MSAARAWLALLSERPDGAEAAADACDVGTGEPAGWLAVWRQAAKPSRTAWRVDPAAFDPGGPAGTVSLVLVPNARAVIFDDLVVQRARQLVLAAAGPWTALTTLVSDAVHFRGSLLGRPGEGGFEDPFTLIAPARRLRVGPGLISPDALRLPAPVIERYAGQPWPQTGF
ncbi:MAG: hypothetical protein JO153_11705 [Solirubrobacterales bacterium]|nr:hypothetical protein [Solirubrobacterales bacterium]MBV9917155.1 hypothetical protein [Solirubrobacterales bacterium]